MNRKDRRIAAKSERAVAPPLVDSLHHRARLALQQGRAADAVTLLRQAVTLAPSDHRLHHRLAEALRIAGQPNDAERHYRRTAELLPSAETCLNLGNILLELRRPGDASEAYQAAIFHDPANPAAQYGLGCAQTALGQVATASFEQAVALAPSFILAQEALVETHRASSNFAAACRAACRALLHVDSPALRASFTNAITQIVPDSGTPGLRQALTRALAERWKRPPELARAVCTLLARQRPIDVDDKLLRALLIAAPICHRDIEAALTAERSRLLDHADNLSPRDLSLACALARQGWINEFAWSVTPREAAIIAELDRDDVSISTSVLLAMYRPMTHPPQAARQTQDIAAVIAQHIDEPAEEARLRARIPAMNAIAGDISLAVRDQYEVNPYPRWIALPSVAQRVPYAASLAHRFPTPSKLPVGTLDLLVAGCGTGQHPLELLNAFTDIDVLAIDLSLSSLAYAARMAGVCGMSNIIFQQADLLRVGELGRSFDVIESSGVLHHMADLWAGWRALLACLRPGGVMSVSLYTKRARADVMRARDWIAAQGFPATPEGMRACRQAMFDLTDDWAINLAASADFATLSGCRDLLFHVHETAVTMPELSSFLSAEGLDLLGVEAPPPIAQAFRAWAADPDAARDLSHWDEFESAHPQCFASMIHLWVQKKNE